MKRLIKSLTLVGVLTVAGVVPTQAGSLGMTASPNPVCSGGSVTLSITHYTGTFYWYLNGNLFASGANLWSYTTADYSTATWSVTGYIAGNWYNDSIVVTVDPTSVGGTTTADASTVCYGGSTTIRLTGNTGAIQWYQSSDCAS
jgi:hypothetical protein